MPILEGEKVTKYFGGLAAVLNVDFTVDEGEILGLIGPNGAGKTTLFNLISAALVPKPGVIKFKGENITGKKPHQICRMGVARTFQIVKIFANMPVIENVRLGSLFGTSPGMSSAEAAREAGEILEFVGLSAAKATPAGDLTLANQKRVEVARALATKPELLLLDETAAGLNPKELDEAMELIRRIRDRGVTIIIVEHIMKVIMSISDRIHAINYGQTITEGTPEQVANNKEVLEAYLGEESYASG